MTVSFIGGGNWRVLWEPPTRHKSLIYFITYSYNVFEYTSSCAGIEHSTLVMICNNCNGRCKFNILTQPRRPLWTWQYMHSEPDSTCTLNLTVHALWTWQYMYSEPVHALWPDSTCTLNLTVHALWTWQYMYSEPDSTCTLNLTVHALWTWQYMYLLTVHARYYLVYP